MLLVGIALFSQFDVTDSDKTELPQNTSAQFLKTEQGFQLVICSYKGSERTAPLKYPGLLCMGDHSSKNMRPCSVPSQMQHAILSLQVSMERGKLRGFGALAPLSWRTGQP